MSRGSRGSLLTSRNSSRRGVLLLVILGMLTLFLMIGTAFIMSGNQYRRANKTYSKVGEQKNLKASQEGFLTEVINQIIRDTANQNSSLRFHSLLRDLYGTEGLVATILPNSAGFAGTTPNFLPAPYTPVGDVTGQQFIEFRFATSDVAPYFDLQGIAHSQTTPEPLNGTVRRLPVADSALNGSILTFLDGPAKGKSTRIVGYFNDPDNNVVSLRTLNVSSPQGIALTDPTVLAGSRILINGRPFNGTGVGYNPLALAGEAKLNAAEQIPDMPDQATLPTPIALMPNAAFFVPVPGTNIAPEYFSTQWASLTAAQRQALVNNMGFEGQGGSDESYDAPDFQNMYLAWTAPNPVESLLPSSLPADITSFTPPNNLGAIVLPSFHRPDLINYWAQQTISGGELALGKTDLLPLLRKVLLRPNWHDHPDFDGSNPEYAALRGDGQEGTKRLLRMIYGPWDVDNDMDGIRDSQWIDFGAPVMVGSKGRLVKPLAAIMVLDMDGRLNVNAHGTRELAGMGTDPIPDPTINPATGTTWNNVPRGQAFGVAEVDLRQILGNEPLRRVMRGEARDYDADGNVDLYIPGRYGYPYQGAIPDDNEPGTKDAFDLSAQLKMQGFPLNLPQRSNFGSLPDLRARYRSALNDFGQFVTTWTPADSNAHSLVEDNPYEMDLSTTGARGEGTSVDNPFSPAELERLLRVYDLDAGTLSPRLFELLKGSQSNADPNDIKNWRALLTTDSYDLPEPSFQLPAWVRTGIPGVGNSDFATVMGRQPVNATYADLIEYRIRAERNWPVPLAGNDANLAAINQQMKMLIAPEMLAGLKLDLNRPLGNGRDDNANGVVDEPGEDEGAFWRLESTRLPATVSTAPGTPAGNFQDDTFQDNPNAAYRDDLDRNGDGTIDIAEQNFNNPTDLFGRANLQNYRRQVLARHLYVLAMSLIDPLPGNTTDTVYREKRQERARQIAQWAINAVDYRDPDNIMTAFEYAVDPFDRWGVDGDITTTNDWHGTDALPGNADDTGGVVWGAEKPELLITETLAWHDRATNDLRTEDPVNDEDGDGQYMNDAAETVGGQFQDTDEDQRFRPQGAAFIELYNPNPPSPGESADTHAIDPTNGNDLGVDLAHTHNGTLTGSPVWRLMAYRSTATQNTSLSRNPFVYGAFADSDPDDADASLHPKPSNPTTIREEEMLKRIARSVYFTNSDPNYTDDGVAYYSSVSNPRDPANPAQGLDTSRPIRDVTVRPGRYLVVGSGINIGGEKYLAKFGEAQSRASTNNRGVILDADPNALHSVMVRNGIDATTPVSDVVGFPLLSPSEAEAQDPTLNINLIPNSDARFRSTASVAIVDLPRRFTLTEPAKGYPNRVHTSSYNAATNQYSPVVDIPLDDQRGTFATDTGTKLPIVNFNKWSDAELQADQLTDCEDRLRLPVEAGSDNVFRVIPGYSWIYLQRLANPTLPYNRITNPYLTVDSSGANVTVFNGRQSREQRWQRASSPENEYWKPLPPPFPVTDSAPPFALKTQLFDFNNGYAVSTFSSLQRGRENNPDPQDAVNDTDIQTFQGEIRTRQANSGNANDPDRFVPGSPDLKVLHDIWNVEQIGKRKRRPVGIWRNRGGNTGNGMGSGDTHWFQGVPDSTLGFMNEPFRGQTAPATDTLKVRDRLKPTDASGNTAPFSLMNWNNRPYANPGELMLVPAYRTLQMQRYASFINPTAITTNIPKQEVYDGPLYDNGIVNTTVKRRFYTEFPYRHLLNFFRTKQDPGEDTTPGTVDDEGIVGLNRVMDFVSVSSLYVGDETWLNPMHFGEALPLNAQTTDPRYGLQPPFNKIASRREPGRVNINTLSLKPTWDGLFHGTTKPDGSDPGHPGPDDDEFWPVRRGYDGIDPATGAPYSNSNVRTNPTLLDQNVPSLFANPYRSNTAGDLVPLPQMRRIGGVGAGLLRPLYLPKVSQIGGALNSDVLDPTPTELEPKNVPFTATISQQAYRNSFRNPYFRYSPISRLSSLTTNRSNVFAIWVTIGFFEVEEVEPWADLNSGQRARYGDDPDVYNRVYPDGYRFGKEAGIETGEVERVREFAIVDRTIPVAFEPGANHNIDEMIRLRRKIKTE